MNIRDLVMPVTFAFLSVFALHYFFPSSTVKERVESTFTAPKEGREYRHIDVGVDFYDKKHVVQSQVTEVETAWGHVNFSTDGASLDSIDFKRESNGHIKTIRTVFPVANEDRSARCFLVALDVATPFYYTRLSFEENEDTYELIYAGSNDNCVIQKVFFIDKNNPKIDLLVEIAPKSGKQAVFEPRILFPAPDMPDIVETDVISSVVIDQAEAFMKKPSDQLDPYSGWLKPMVFGADNRYFVHALINDADHFVQRAYYKLDGKVNVFAILEGPAITEKTSWMLSFYFGPKELSALMAVDPRLEKTLDYSGRLSFLAKLMLYLLKWFYFYLHSYGLAIIALALLIQIFLLPFSLRSDEEKFKQKQAEYQRQLAYIEQRFKDKPDQLLAERTELIRKNGLPFPGLGCLLPIIIQFPLFIALRNVLVSSFELYHAPMLWISDLSLKDPYYILPLLVVCTMLLQDGGGSMGKQQRATKVGMAFLFGAFTSSLSAGLTLYILMGQLFGSIKMRVVKYCKAGQ